MTLSIEDAKERAARGAALLDEKREDNWRARIDTTNLDLSSVHCCVLGQLFDGKYYGGIQELFSLSDYEDMSDAEFAEIVRHGFAAEAVEDYAVLQRAWLELLEEGVRCTL